MATGRTISANSLTDHDKQIIDLCESISKRIETQLPTESRDKFRAGFGKISKNRDAGAGRGGGKLQRDALCTRGIQGKAPFSNRNLRWHPLVAARNPIKFAKEIERIEIEGAGDAQMFVIHIIDQYGQMQTFRSDQVWQLPERYVILPRHWQPHRAALQFWNDTLWTQNSCIITAYEACNWQDAVESYAVLGISVAVNFYGADFPDLYSMIVDTLQQQTIQKTIKLPSAHFPKSKDDIVNCPLCMVPASGNPAKLADRIREERWKPEWANDKRGEGEDASMQIMHVLALTEMEMRHNAQNVRFGHRWCNVAMTDHSIEETVDFMEYIVEAHGR